MTETIFTIGHSTRTIDEFIRMLQAQQVQHLIDVRTIPRSRHNPQFVKEDLAASLAAADIGYEHKESLGGLRHTTRHSPNGAWRNASFRGYADYMQTQAFAVAVDELMALGETTRVAIMCAEAVPWRCHRSLIGDALLARGADVLDIMGDTILRPHSLTSFAKVDGSRVTYPPESAGPEEGGGDAGRR